VQGARAVAGAIMAVMGVLAASYPACGILRALNDAVPQLAAAVPIVITGCGAVIAAFSPPPRFRGGNKT